MESFRASTVNFSRCERLFIYQFHDGNPSTPLTLYSPPEGLHQVMSGQIIPGSITQYPRTLPVHNADGEHAGSIGFIEKFIHLE